jgi:hypothetical protein
LTEGHVGIISELLGFEKRQEAGERGRLAASTEHDRAVKQAGALVFDVEIDLDVNVRIAGLFVVPELEGNDLVGGADVERCTAGRVLPDGRSDLAAME